MIRSLTLVFTISLLLIVSSNCWAQEELIEEEPTVAVQTDSLESQTNNKYGLRVGIDLSRPLRTILDDNFSGFQINGDFRIKKNYYLAAEIGNESRTLEENTFTATAKGSYIKAGFNYNAYENWYGMSNLIYVGIRAGFSTFSQELTEYTIYTRNTYFEPDFRQNDQNFSGLNATWLEVQIGVQAELFNNLYLGLNLQLKRLITQKEANGFDTLYIPGFNKVTTNSNFGVGYGYTLSYLIPLFKK